MIDDAGFYWYSPSYAYKAKTFAFIKIPRKDRLRTSMLKKKL